MRLSREDQAAVSKMRAVYVAAGDVEALADLNEMVSDKPPPRAWPSPARILSIAACASVFVMAVLDLLDPTFGGARWVSFDVDHFSSHDHHYLWLAPLAIWVASLLVRLPPPPTSHAPQKGRAVICIPGVDTPQ